MPGKAGTGQAEFVHGLSMLWPLPQLVVSICPLGCVFDARVALVLP